ncbi:MAG TPA: carbohydrate ABC transporter permease [Actinomycetota bacterium]
MRLYRWRVRRTWGHTVAVAVVAAVFVVPLVALVTGSLRVPGLPPPRTLELIPDPATLDGYRDAFSLSPLARSMVNSLVVAAVFVPLAVVSASWAGFAIALSRERLRRRLIALALLLMMVPATALWLTRFVIFKIFGMVDTFWPLIVPALLGGSPLAVLLYAYAFGRIPDDLYDAARLEGLSPIRIWRRVAMPLVRATTVAVAMLAFLSTWANFIDPLLYLNTERRFTAPLTLRYLEQLGPTNWPVLLAGAAAVTGPAVLVFLLAQRFFLQEERGVGWLGR